MKKALGTKSIDDAIAKRDALVIADDDYWLALSLEVIEQGGVSDTSLELQKIKSGVESRGPAVFWV